MDTATTRGQREAFVFKGHADLQGVAVALLTAADEHAGRVYERIGFRPYATLLAYGDEVD